MTEAVIDTDHNPVTTTNIDDTPTSMFTPSQYDAKLTMDGTAQSVALATAATKVFVVNTGATTEDLLFAFGTSAANAESNLNMTTDGAPESATTGHYIPSPADSYGSVVLGVPSDATHYAVANATDSDTQVVWVTQGV